MTDNTRLSIEQVMNLLLGVIVCAIVIAIVIQRVDKALKINAVDGCMKASRFERTFPEDNSKISSPMSDIYKNCMKDKGY